MARGTGSRQAGTTGTAAATTTSSGGSGSSSTASTSSSASASRGTSTSTSRKGDTDRLRKTESQAREWAKQAAGSAPPQNPPCPPGLVFPQPRVEPSPSG